MPRSQHTTHHIVSTFVNMSFLRTIGALSIATSIVCMSVACNYTKRVKSGEEAFEIKQYAVAAEMLASEYSESENPAVRAEKAYMVGKSYENMNQALKASDWYATAAEIGYGDEAYISYAQMLVRTEEYGEAIRVYEFLRGRPENQSRFRAEMTACRQAMQWKEDESKSAFEVSDVIFNSVASDYAPFIYGPQMVLFTSDRPSGSGEVYSWTGRGYSDIYMANLAGGRIEEFDPVINSPYNEGTVAMNSDRSQIIFSRCFDSGNYDYFCKLMWSQKSGGIWSEPEALPFVQEDINYGHPVLTGNDSILIYSANDPEGEGGYDLFVATFDENGWSTPVSLSNTLNTAGNEKFPSMHEDTLYFASDYHVGMGGLDVFKSYLTASGAWTPPINMKPPINSGADDFGFVVDTFARLTGTEIQKGYFVTSRDNVDGTDDVMGFTRRRIDTSEQEDIADAEEEEPDIRYQLFLAVRVMEPVFEDANDPNSKRIGKRPLTRARVYVGQGVRGQTFQTDEEGLLVLEIDYDKLYNLNAQFRGFLSRRVDFNSATIERDPEDPVKTHNIEIVLEPIFRGKEIVLQNIYYDLDKWDIRKDAEPSLNELVSILKDNPKINIELGSHTDCRADDDYNMDLSQKRAQSAVDYLVAKGIPAPRLTAVGYGETAFAINCICEECTEDEHQANRRTTFKIR